jgi:C_GCAxxG_C_C family probable redox protein
VQDLTGQSDERAIRMMGGFGGGIGGMGSVCGAVVGAVAALGADRGKGTLEEKENARLFPLTAELYRRFSEEIEVSPLCREITGIDFTRPEQVKEYRNSPEKMGRCVKLVGKTAAMVYEMLQREEQNSSS